ncbi:hypothetical protein PMIN06_009379 [Paraphaeosphaeria minitans]|uniref:Uncharacterized protein n=1 Tax=Paraphaeosphaeria minitans TaxID=565426 RepID=A0A9P6G686_9PLEO|nr:hypothetical protein PMIN01_12332 [Paraphaeosphaeria minitans]
MSDLPRTTYPDLEHMGFNQENLTDLMKSLGKYKDSDGTVFGIVMPWPEVFYGAIQAVNYVKSDWTLVSTDPPVIESESHYDKLFDNFEGTSDITNQFQNSTTVTTGADYSLTQTFDVSVNGNLPLGTKGALLGFHANMNKTEVNNKSYHKSETHSSMFDVQIPAGEARKVVETTREKTTLATYEAKIGVRGSLGIDVDEGLYIFTHVAWCTNIEDHMPDKTATATITVTWRSTEVDTQILKITKGDKGELIETPTELRTTSFPSPPAEDGGANNAAEDNAPPQTGFAIKFRDQDNEAGLADLTQSATIRVSFTMPSSATGAQRHEAIERLRAQCLLDIKPHEAIGIPGPAGYIPSPNAPSSATFTLRFDPSLTDRNLLRQGVFLAAGHVNWHGAGKLISVT